MLSVGPGTATSVQAAATGNLFGLVVGINDYLGDKNDLEGSINDAEDIANALDYSKAKSVVRLFDAAATKDAITESYRSLIDAAAAGDTLVFSFSGHGSQEAEPKDRHGEADGKNENLLLSSFSSKGAGSRERIVDDEIFEWLKAADDKGVKVIFVVDACHSGSMNRSVGSNRVKYRNVEIDAITDDQLDFPPPEFSTVTEDGLKNITFIGATTDDKLTPEVRIEGKWRGALSWAFARAIEGNADRNGDGAVDQFELIGYLVPTVHSWVESQQTPQVEPLRPLPEQLFAVGKPPERPLAVASSKAASEGGLVRKAELEPLKVAIKGGGELSTDGLNFVERSDDEASADIIYDPASGTLDHRIGGNVASGLDAETVRGALNKHAVLKWLRLHAAEDPVDAKVMSGDQRYKPNDTISVSIGRPKHGFLTLFNLPPDGRVELFLPKSNDAGESMKDWREGKPFEAKFRVDRPPFGAEHLVAIFTDEPLSGPAAVMEQMSSGERALPLIGLLEQALAGKSFQAGILDIYTGSEAQ